MDKEKCTDIVSMWRCVLHINTIILAGMVCCYFRRNDLSNSIL